MNTVKNMSEKKSVLGSRYVQMGLLSLAAATVMALGAWGGQADAASCTANTYRKGASGNCVRYIQQIINASGATSKIDTDGAFGSDTKKAVVAFQKSTKVGTKKAIADDGIVGKDTWKKLCAVTQSAATTPKKNAGCTTSSPSPAPKGEWKTVYTETPGKYAYGERNGGYNVISKDGVVDDKSASYRICITGAAATDSSQGTVTIYDDVVASKRVELARMTFTKKAGTPTRDTPKTTQCSGSVKGSKVTSGTQKQFTVYLLSSDRDPVFIEKIQLQKYY